MFKFRFQKALEQKEREEKDRKNELFKLRGILEAEKEKERKIEFEISQFVKEYESKKMGRLDIFQLKKYEIYLSTLKVQKENQKQVIQKAEEAVSLGEINHNEARKELKTFEKLKEKQFEQYRQEEILKENKLIDELSNSMYNRRK